MAAWLVLGVVATWVCTLEAVDSTATLSDAAIDAEMAAHKFIFVLGMPESGLHLYSHGSLDYCHGKYICACVD